MTVFSNDPPFGKGGLFKDASLFTQGGLFKKSGVAPPPFEGVGLETVPSVLADLCAQWDGGLDGSVAGTTPTEIVNTVTTPADGSTNTEWDRYNGEDAINTDALTFVGTVGVGGSYLTTDSTQMMIQKLAQANIPDILKKLHQTSGSTWSWVTAFQSNFDQNSKVHFNTLWNDGTNNEGLYNNSVASTDGLNFSFVKDGAFNVLATAGAPLTSFIDIIMCITWDNGVFKYAFNAPTFTSGSTMPANTTEESGPMQVFGELVFGNRARFGARWYGDAFLNTNISESQWQDIIAWYEGHTGIDFF